jgi:hypothetical protein
MSRDNNIITPIINNLDNNYDSSFNFIHPNYEQDFFINMLANVMLDAQIPLNNEPSEIQNILNQSMNDSNPIKYVISEEEKSKLLPVRFKDIQCKDENTKCLITQEEFKDDDKVIQLPCNHCFIEECIMNWLTKEKGECPVCRYKFECIEVRDETQNEAEFNNIQIQPQYRNDLNYYNNFFILPNYLINEPGRRLSGESYFNFFQFENQIVYNNENDDADDDTEDYENNFD